MEIRSLRYAVTLAEELHFGRAAQRHFIAAQPFGRHIQRLEREVGRRLFERTSRRVTLTPAGERLVAEARKVLAVVDGLAELARADAPPPLRVGVLGSGVAQAWPVLVGIVARQVPELVLEHRELDLTSQYEAVRAGRVDVGVVQYAGPVDGLVFDRMASGAAVVPVQPTYADMERLLAEPGGRSAGCSAAVAWAGAGAAIGSGAVAVAGVGAAPAAESGAVPVPVPAVGAVAVATRVADGRPGVLAFRRAARLLGDRNRSR